MSKGEVINVIMIELYEGTNIYVACPAGVATGGPELLHQLCFNLRNVLKANAYMYYYPANIVDPVHSAYKHYGVPFVREIEDNFRNVLVVPEIRSGMALLKNVKEIRKVVWFLGVDTYFLSRLKKTDFLVRRVANKFFKALFKRILFDINIDVDKPKFQEIIRKDSSLKGADLVMAQSWRAFEFLRTSGYKPVYLSDYLNESFLKSEIDFSKKEDIIAYNPKKGLAFTHKIVARAPDLRFVPLENMTRDEVIKLLQRAKVYIDFGNHPGKDRLPREAAILGCCVITGKRGSAAYFEDVPIPESYKFEDREENIPAIIAKIRYCLSNFAQCSRDFDHYREIIRQEPQKFIEDLKRIFVKV